LYLADESISGNLVILSWIVFVVFGAASIEVVYDLERPWWLAVTSLLVGPTGWLLLELVLT
jgi:hypothetical protein